MDLQEGSFWDLIQAKAAALRTKEEELGEKERLLAAELEKLHRAVEALEREREESARVGVELEALRRGLDAREAELEQQLKGLKAQRGVIGETSSRMDALEKHLLERRAKLSAQEDQLTLLEEGLLGDDRDMVEQRVRVMNLEAEFVRLCTPLAATLESDIQKGNALLEREAEMARQEADLSAKERDILDEAKRLASLELGLLAAPPKAASSEATPTPRASSLEGTFQTPVQAESGNLGQPVQTLGFTQSRSTNLSEGGEMSCHSCGALMGRDAIVCHVCGRIVGG